MVMMAVPEVITQSWYNTTQLDADFGINGNWTTAIRDNSSCLLPLQASVIMKFRETYIWVLVCVGLPCNAACLVTVVTTRVMPYYVALLAIVDTATLIVKLIYHQIYTYSANNAASCYFICTSSFFSCLANWTLVLICFDRYLAVCRPYKRQVWFNKRRMVVTFVVVTGFLSVGILPTCFFSDGANESGSHCRIRQGMERLNYEWGRWVTAQLFSTVPFLFISVLTTLSVRGLQRMRIRRQSISTDRQSGPEHAVSAMMVGACLVFLLLTLPATLFYTCLSFVMGEGTLELYTVYQVVTFLADANHAVNFFIYCLASASFRKAVWILLRRCLRLIKADGRRNRDVERVSAKDQTVNNTADSNGSEILATEGKCTVPVNVVRDSDTAI